MQDSQTKLRQLEQIVVRHQDELFRFAFFRTGSHADAEDIVQNVMLRLFRSECNLSHIDNVRSYLMRAIANGCTDYHRRKRPCNISVENAATIADEQQTRDEEYKHIGLLLDTLPEDQSEVIRMKTSDSLTFVQIAEITGESVSTVKSRFRYGVSKLRKLINH